MHQALADLLIAAATPRRGPGDRRLESAALRYAAAKLTETGEAGTRSAAVLLAQLDNNLDSER